MGRSVNYVRRKRDSKCFNPQVWERIDSLDICSCTEEDFECDVGFFRDDSGACLRTDETLISYDPPDNCNGYYEVSLGYRKVTGDSCMGGV